MKRNLLLAAMILVAFVTPQLIVGQNIVKDELKKIIAEMNSEMPMSLGSMGIIESISLDGDSIVYNIKCDFYENFTNGNTAPEIQNSNDKIKLTFANMAQTDDSFKIFLNYLSENGIWFKGDISIGNKSTKFTISPTEQIKILNSEPNYKLFIEMNIAQTKDSLPLDLGMMKMIGYDLFENNLVATIEIDESQINIANLKSSQESMKNNIINVLKSGNEPILNEVMTNCAMAGYNCVYKYVGNISKENVSITLTTDEILSSLGL